uniref:RING-type domain-containing protein n=1 Tax=Pseudonaja textilis TaxID=8673 RepID=A0A670Y157_PSETE
CQSEGDNLADKLTCCICLEMFTIPVTVPCGHSFCEKCINSHWDKEEQGLRSGQKICTCPECRKIFPERPKLSKTVQLENLVELLKLGEFPPGNWGRWPHMAVANRQRDSCQHQEQDDGKVSGSAECTVAWATVAHFELSFMLQTDLFLFYFYFIWLVNCLQGNRYK